MESLWPSVENVAKEETPKSILREQAKLLTQESKAFFQGGISSGKRGETLTIELVLNCPSVGYQTRLLSASYGLLSIYPAEVIVEGEIARELTGNEGKATLQAQNKEEFIAQVSRVLNSQRVVQIMRALKQHA